MKPLSSWMSGVWVLAIILGLTGASCTTQVTTDHRPPTASEPDAATKATIQAAYGKLPLHFEANQGQSDKQVKFLSRGSGYTLFLTSTEAVLALHKPAPAGHGDAETRGHGDTETVAASTTADAATLGAALGPEPLALSPQPSALLLRMQLVGANPQPHKNPLAPVSEERVRVRGPDPELTEQMVLRLQLVGANPDPQVTGLDELPGKSHYFLGNDPKDWHTNVPTYARVQYKDIYPGIDLIYYGNQRQLEYDFVVSPGADPGVIRLAFDGLAPSPLAGEACPERSRRGQDGGRSGLPLQIDDNGDLILHTACSEPCRSTGGELRLHKPRIYQEINGVKQPIPGSYILLKPRTSNLEPQQVSFQVAAYDTSKPLIIDPTLSYSTYLGGSGNDIGYGITVDSSGNAYVAGHTASTNFPAASPFQAANGGLEDVFVTKLNAAGSALVYSTYLGGNGDDFGRDIVVDASGNAYVTGRTASTNFPTASPFQPAFGGTSDAFVAKINALGSLVYSTYLGGSDSDGGNRIAVDSSGNAYVAGSSTSTNFPTAGALQATFGGGTSDAFVTKVNAAGSALVYSTYLGGSSTDYGYGIAVDSSGNAYVTGFTDSTNFPTASPIQAANGGSWDVFATKVNAIGSALVYSTYLGGSSTDYGYSIAVDSSGNAYVTGRTDSTNFPTASPIQAANGGGIRDAFVTKLNAAGSLVYSTYLGGSSTDYGYSIAVDSSGNAYVTGRTDSTNFPTASPIQAANGGGIRDAFVTKLNAAGSLVYSTYLGGSGDDVGVGIAVDSSGNAYVTGDTTSTNFPTQSPFQGTYGGGPYDAFVAKIAEEPNPALSVTPTSLDFGSVTVGSTKDLTFTVTNSGGGTLTGSVTTTSPYSIVSGSSFSLTASQSQTVTVRFSPTSSGTFLGNASVSSNGGSASVTLTGTGTDTTPPTITITSPTSDTTYTATTSSLTLGGTASDNVGVTQVTWSNAATGGSGTASGTTSWTASGITLNSGTNVLTVTATDAAGNTGTDTLTVTYTPPDTTAPTVTITSPTSSSTYSTSSSTVTLGGTASDNVEVTQVTWSSDRGGSGTATGTTSWSAGPITLQSGTNVLTVTAQDAAGNTGTDALTVTYTPTQDPVVSVTPTSLDFGSVTVNSSKDLTFTVTNSGGGTLTGSVTTSSPFSIVSGGSFSLTAGQSQTVTVRFSPTTTGAFTGTVSVSSNGGSATVTLSGTGTKEEPPLLSVSPTTFSLWRGDEGQQQ